MKKKTEAAHLINQKHYNRYYDVIKYTQLLKHILK